MDRKLIRIIYFDVWSFAIKAIENTTLIYCNFIFNTGCNLTFKLFFIIKNILIIVKLLHYCECLVIFSALFCIILKGVMKRNAAAM